MAACASDGPYSGRCFVAVVDAATGTQQKWATEINGVARQLAVGGNALYVGGDFTNVVDAAAVGRNRLAALDTRTGTLLSWNPNPDYGNGIPTIHTVVASGNTVYIGGRFTTIGGAARSSIAAVDAISGSALAWDAAIGSDNGVSEVRTIVPDGATLYIGGSFSSAGGQVRSGLAALDRGSAAALLWDAGLTLDADSPALVTALAVNADRVFIGGQFKLPGSATATRSAALAKHNAEALPWLDAGDQHAAITQLGVGGSQVFVGGSFAVLGAKSRNHVAAIDLTSGQVTDWDPNAPNLTGDASSGGVRQLLVAGSTVYAAGSFSRIGGADRPGLAALDGATGIALAWNPQIAGSVYAMAASSTTLYVSGTVTTVNGQPRSGLAAFDLVSGQPTTWAPSAPIGGVVRLVATESTVYLGGALSSVAGHTRNGVAALDAHSGALLNWNPDVRAPLANFNVADMALADGVLYLVGQFDQVGGQTRLGIAAVAASSGVLLPWSPIALITPRAVMVSGDRVYVAVNKGGGTPPAQAVLTLSISQNAMVPTSYVVEGSVNSIVAAGERLFFGGDFTDAATLPAPNLANFGK